MLPFRSSSVITANISDIRPKTVEKATLTKDARTEKNSNPKCANCKGPHVANYKGCPVYKKQVFRQHVVDNQKSYASILKQNLVPTPQPRGDTFTFTADQLVKFDSHCGHTNRSATGVLHHCPKRCSWQKVKSVPTCFWSSKKSTRHQYLGKHIVWCHR